MTAFKKYPWSILLYLTVLILSIMPVPETPLGDVPLMDKWTHFVMYCAVGCAAWMDWSRKKASGLKLALWTVAVPVLYGGLMELIQAYCTTYRSGEWMDVLANSCGVLLSIPIGYFVIRRLTTKTSKTPSA